MNDTDLVTIIMNGVTDDYQIFITWINAREKIAHFEELIGILMQEKERRSTLKPQSPNLALMAKKNFYKGKGSPQQQNGASSQKRPNLTQGMHLNKNYFEPKCFYCGKLDHIARDCRKKKYHEEQQKPKRHARHLANGDQVQNLRLFMADLMKMLMQTSSM